MRRSWLISASYERGRRPSSASGVVCGTSRRFRRRRPRREAQGGERGELIATQVATPSGPTRPWPARRARLGKASRGYSRLHHRTTPARTTSPQRCRRKICIPEQRPADKWTNGVGVTFQERDLANVALTDYLASISDQLCSPGTHGGLRGSQSPGRPAPAVPGPRARSAANP